MSETVGARIKKFREKKNVSLEELAQRTGLDQDFLAAVEEGLYPSLGPLLKVARGLGLRLGTFLDDSISKDPVIVRLSERQEELITHKGKGKPEELRFHSLGRGKSDRHMEPFYIEVLPESGKDQALSSHEGEEFIVVISGQVKLVHGQDTQILEAGDTAYYNSLVPHHLGCHGQSKAEIYAVLYIPD